jgi:FtsP/CotA-like multicopper oxidase with cupredoxin domain
MHPEVTSSEPGTCPKCGMKLVPADTLPATEPIPGEDAVHHEHQEHEQNDGLEWEDLMPEINRASEPSNVRWMLIDRESGAENGAITWAFTVGDRVKIRLVTRWSRITRCTTRSMSTAPGASSSCRVRASRNPTLVWKDTVLVPAGWTVDVLLDVSNPGLWMAHCHIAEHAQSGMMFSFNVSRRDPVEVTP